MGQAENAAPQRYESGKQGIRPNEITMETNEIDVKNVKQYWVKEAEEAFGVAEHLFQNEDYSYTNGQY